MTTYTRFFPPDVAIKGVDSLNCRWGKNLYRQQTHSTIHAPFQSPLPLCVYIHEDNPGHFETERMTSQWDTLDHLRSTMVSSQFSQKTTLEEISSTAIFHDKTVVMTLKRTRVEVESWSDSRLDRRGLSPHTAMVHKCYRQR